MVEVQRQTPHHFHQLFAKGIVNAPILEPISKIISFFSINLFIMESSISENSPYSFIAFPMN